MMGCLNDSHLLLNRLLKLLNLARISSCPITSIIQFSFRGLEGRFCHFLLLLSLLLVFNCLFFLFKGLLEHLRDFSFLLLGYSCLVLSLAQFLQTKLLRFGQFVLEICDCIFEALVLPGFLKFTGDLLKAVFQLSCHICVFLLLLSDFKSLVLKLLDCQLLLDQIRIELV